jgi:hypothetical protein
MKNCSLLLLTLTAVVFASPLAARAQTSTPPSYTRPRIVNPANSQEQQTQAKPTPTPMEGTRTDGARTYGTPSRPTVAAPTVSQPQNQGRANSPAATPTPLPSPTIAPAVVQPFVPAVPLQPARPISPNKFRASHTEAQRLLKSRLTLTSMTPSLSSVTVAALDQESSQIHLLTLPKQTFLTRGAEIVMTSSKGMNVRLQVVRSNYVNTAVVVSDMQGRQLVPLVVEYPIEKFGTFREMAYYTSAHPALMTPELVKAGQSYVRTMLDFAAKRLKDKNKIISPQIVDIAERLCVVEHVDHDRFRREDRGTLYGEVYALFALNELDTYRYSVSSAGAGGMVQMIPSTYQMLRRLHPGVGLNPDFVAGMRNHGNALEAMLLHMQDNWNELGFNSEVLDAMSAGSATQPELVAAGYNSNSARLPGYIRRGGASWRVLIPRETQMYLQIYKSVESLMPFKDRSEKKGQE